MEDPFKNLSFFGFEHVLLKAGMNLEIKADSHCRIIIVSGQCQQIECSFLMPGDCVKYCFDTIAEVTILKYHLSFNPEGYPHG